jgi:hypothetical protein
MMKIKLLSVTLLALASLSTAEARDPRRSDQEAAFKDTQLGAVRSLRSIENAIVPGMEAKGASYIGQEYYQDNQRYRLKFMRGKSLIWVDVDGKSGAIIGQAGG